MKGRKAKRYTRHQSVALLQQGSRHRLGVQHHLSDVLFEHGSGSLQTQVCRIKNLANEETDYETEWFLDMFFFSFLMEPNEHSKEQWTCLSATATPPMAWL